MSKNGIQTPNFAHKIETCINPFRKWCTTYFIILMMQSWDQLWKTNTKTRQKWTELKEKSPFTIKKRKCGIDVVCYQVPNHVVKFINEKRGAIFDIYLQRKKQSQKYCVKFFALNCPRRFVLELHNFFWWCFILDYHY